MAERLILQIAGQARSGKSEVSRYLADEHNFTVVLISDIIRAYADMYDIPLELRADYLKAHREMKKHFGVEIVTDTILEASGERVCVDGIRVPNDVARLREIGSKVIALDCPVEIRFARAVALQSPLDRLSIDEFVQDDEADAYNSNLEIQGTKRVIDEADYRVDSSRPLPDVLQDIDEIVVPLL